MKHHRVISWVPTNRHQKKETKATGNSKKDLPKKDVLQGNCRTSGTSFGNKAPKDHPIGNQREAPAGKLASEIQKNNISSNK